MKFGTQQQIWNSMTVTWQIWKLLKFKMATAAILKLVFGHNLQPIARFQLRLWSSAWGSNFHSISAMGQIPCSTEHRYRVPQNVFLVFLMQFGLRRAAPFVSPSIHLFHTFANCFIRKFLGIGLIRQNPDPAGY